MKAQRSRRWESLALLWLAYFFYQADKQIYAVVLPPLRAELGLSGYEAGLVATVFSLMVALFSPVAGACGDRWPKGWLLAGSVALWSAGTAFSGVASSLAWLLVARSVVTGGAEAFYPPVAHAYLAERHTQTRALAISIHQTAQYAGPIAAGFLAGWLAERFGWRASFVVFGVPGLVLAALLWMRLDKPAPSGPREALWEGFRQCFALAGVRRVALAFACVLFVSIGYHTWAPTIFGRQFGLSLAAAGLQTALWSSGAAMVGALAGGVLSDAMARRGRSRLELQAAALLAGAPALWMLGAATTLESATAALAAVSICRGIYEGTLAVTLYDFVAARHRASAAAAVLLTANLLAAPSAAMLGWLSDRVAIGAAVSGLSLLFAAGAAILFASRGLPRHAGYQ